MSDRLDTDQRLEERRPDDGPVAHLPADSGIGDPTASIEEFSNLPSGTTAAEDEWQAGKDPESVRRSRVLLADLVRPHGRRLLGTTVLMVAHNLLNLLGPLLIGLGIDRALPALTGRDDAGPLVLVAGAYAVCGLGGALARMWFVRASARIAQDMMVNLRGRVFQHAQRLSLDFHERYTSGRIISRGTSDVDTLRELAEEGLDGLVNVVLSSVLTLVLLLFLDLPLGLLVLTGLFPLVLATRWFQRSSRRAYRRTRSSMAELIVHYSETMNGIRAVQAFRREKRGEKVFAELTETYAAANVRGSKLLAAYIPMLKVVGAVTLAVVLAIGAVRVVDGGLALGVLTSFVLYVRRLYDPLDQLAMFINSYQSGAAALEKVADLLARRPSVVEPEVPQRLPERTSRGREVRFEQVSFSYRPGVPVLPRFDLVLPPGQTCAVVGATGAGKSTLAKLLARFYDPSEGRVLLDGVDLRRLDNQGLRRNVVMVTQESFLFAGSVAENIAVGRPDATREEVERVARAIGAHDFIAAMPDGYDTDVRKRGGRLSAGQRQLISFARALLADPAVLILDEATSSLDVPGERAVQQAMRTVLAGRTSVIIAHRLSTVEVADRVLVMEGGRIVEDGSPAELIAGTGRFSDLHRQWRDSLV
ncbi:ABC transporter ATP-binding protein [Allostreptomyces psammosilenae]|uniref:ATP-binding cassette subfamily B protein n=1 Tax=Allostreptomyces psammosilenae TaxID=1892865 RepID=A0A852ZZ73_9ACTN|nr:ABC transporter ATP-binding protein [Allostreptomyces psammosilenae]NYI06520.1 ATP-binding cassette subfamily B protein [Allostreptomyces psammosilenae]